MLKTEWMVMFRQAGRTCVRHRPLNCEMTVIMTVMIDHSVIWGQSLYQATGHISLTFFKELSQGWACVGACNLNGEFIAQHKANTMYANGGGGREKT